MLKMFSADENVIIIDYITSYLSFSYEKHILMMI